MKECSKSIPRRLADSSFVRRYFVGHGLDIGGKPDPLMLYQELFCRMESVRTWDIEDGDAQYLHGMADDGFDFVHSSHCLEHLRDPVEGLKSWFRIVKPNGHLVVTVPDEDLYEQGVFPSTFNRDHKWTFTVWKEKSWSPKSINLLALATELGPQADIIKIELLHAAYRTNLPRYDQTLTPVGECGIELVVRKRTREELEFGGTSPRIQREPDREKRLHLNQYRDDLATLKQSNEGKPPFLNDKEI